MGDRETVGRITALTWGVDFAVRCLPCGPGPVDALGALLGFALRNGYMRFGEGGVFAAAHC